MQLWLFVMLVQHSSIDINIRHTEFLPGLRICSSLMLIRIQLFTSLRIRICIWVSLQSWSEAGSCFSCKPATTIVFIPSRASFWISAVLFVSVYGLLKLLNFDYNADPDFHSLEFNTVPDPTSENNLDPDPQPWLLHTNLPSKHTYCIQYIFTIIRELYCVGVRNLGHDLKYIYESFFWF